VPAEKFLERAATAGPVNPEIQDLIQQKAGRTLMKRWQLAMMMKE